MGNQVFNMVARLDIADFLGSPNAILQKFGLMVYREAHRIVAAGKSVELYFGNLRNTTTGFFHASVGNLAKDFGSKYEQLVTVTGLEGHNDWVEKYNDAIELATNPEMVKEIDKAIAELFVS